MKHGRLIAFSALLAATLALAGCGSSDDTGAQGSAASGEKGAAGEEQAAAAEGACALLTAAEVEEALGESVSEPQPQDLGTLQTCKFAGDGAQFRLLLGIRDQSPLSARQFFEMHQKRAQDPQTLSGIGTAAFSTTSPKTEVMFYLGTEEVTLTLTGDDELSGDPAARVADLAKKVAARL
ncbi:hypothetical protein EV385_5546 [Krasilnikovia cinnamomea]|uniref:DUF3558 domain-containing protein n=1 Tax=Krasilnikovia cinnamomea TaxID=349313 RepID=A0A4Q7ZSX0_9ACTN|nr:hypothetical protein [Krasilnikovia cinnamomea]RZU53615.1 hypothetical protein EV385_5546 [Krasilnikovia cinnamomea]